MENDNAIDEFFDNDIRSAALVPLLWETIKAKQDRPVLDLSSFQKLQTLQGGDDDDDKDAAVANDKANDADTSSWDQGQRWEETFQGLQQLGIVLDFDDNDNERNNGEKKSLVQACPQLLRLETQMVLNTARWFLEEFPKHGKEMIQKEPRLLSYPSLDAAYGLEFLSTMMMISNKDQLVNVVSMAPQLLQSGIDGGLQERAVTQALGQASQATSQANQQLASNAMTSLKLLQSQKKRPKQS